MPYRVVVDNTLMICIAVESASVGRERYISLEIDEEGRGGGQRHGQQLQLQPGGYIARRIVASCRLEVGCRRAGR